ncbi:hypothetical protein [Bacteroides heparinolyticus]
MKEALILRLPRELKKRLKDEAERTGHTMTGFILMLIWDYFNEKQKQEEK